MNETLLEPIELLGIFIYQTNKSSVFLQTGAIIGSDSNACR